MARYGPSFSIVAGSEGLCPEMNIAIARPQVGQFVNLLNGSQISLTFETLFLYLSLSLSLVHFRHFSMRGICPSHFLPVSLLKFRSENAGVCCVGALAFDRPVLPQSQFVECLLLTTLYVANLCTLSVTVFLIREDRFELEEDCFRVFFLQAWPV